MSTDPRFEVIIDRSDFTSDIDGLEGVESLDEAWEVVTQWVDKNHASLRLDCEHNRGGTTELETTAFELMVTDTEDEDGASVSDNEYYVLPDEPDDADGKWEYRGCYNSREYRVCGSIEGEADWWWIEDCSDLGGRDGCPDRTYTQDTSLLHKELQPRVYKPRFQIEIDGNEVDEVEVCSYKGVVDLDDIEDADEMLDAVMAYVGLGYYGGESGHRFEIDVWSADIESDDNADGWVELEESEGAI
jgi:hypothetical protein